MDPNAEGHAKDAVVYFLVSRPPLAEKIPEPRDPDTHPGLNPDGTRRKLRPWQEHLARGGVELEPPNCYLPSKEMVPIEW